MNSRFGSFKLIFHFLIFLIFLLFCVLNVFFYDIYKKDTLLILSNYEKTMQHDHGEILLHDGLVDIQNIDATFVQ